MPTIHSSRWQDFQAWEILILPPLRPEKMKAKGPSFFLEPRARAAGQSPKGSKAVKPAKSNGDAIGKF
jgi:hypothetical protein